MILNISNFYINFKTHGFKSWRTYLSLFSIISTIFIASLFYSDIFSNNVKLLLLKTIELVTCLWLLFIYILEHKPHLSMGMQLMKSGPNMINEKVIKEVNDQFGPLNVLTPSEEDLYKNYKRQKSPYRKDIGEGDEKPFRRKQLSWYPPTKPYDPKDPRSPYHPYHLLYRHTDYQGLWRDRYKYIKGPLAHIKFSESYYDIHEKKYLPHTYKNSAKLAEETPEPVIRKKHVDYKPTHPDWVQNTPNYKQWQKTIWREKYPRMIAKDVIDESYIQENEKSKPKRKLIYKKSSPRPRVIFPKNKEMLMNNHPLNKWSKYTNMKVKNNIYIIKPKSIDTNIESKKINYQWERNTKIIKKQQGQGINTNFENKNQIKNQYQSENDKIIKRPKEVVYIDRLESESKYKSVYVDVDLNTGRVFIKEMPIDYNKRNLELENREYNLEKLIKFKKINNNICRIQVNYEDTPLPWYRDKKVLSFKNIFKSAYEGKERPDYVDLPLSVDGTLTIFDPERFNFKTKQEKIEAGIKMKEALTDYNGIGSIKYILDDNLKNDEYTSKQIKKNMKKNKPILMVEERYLPKESTKNKIKSFIKKYTIGLVKGKSNVTKEIIEHKEQKEQVTKDLTKKQKEKLKIELEKKRLEELSKKKDIELKVNKKEERMTPPLLRESESEDSDSDSDSHNIPARYKVYWDEKPVELNKKKKKLPLLSFFEDKTKNKSLPLIEEFPWTDKSGKDKPLPLTPIEKEILKKANLNTTNKKVPLSINELLKEDIKIIRWMNGIPHVIQENIEELRDEDLPVLPYKSPKRINIEESLNIKSEEKLKNKNSIEEVINKKTIQVENNINKEKDQNENIIKEEGIKKEEVIKEDIIQDEKEKEKEKSLDKNIIQENKSEGKKLEEEKKTEKDRKPDYSIFDKEYKAMFPPKRPEDYNGQVDYKSHLTKKEKEAAFNAYYETNAPRFLRSYYNPIYPEPVDDSYNPSASVPEENVSSISPSPSEGDTSQLSGQNVSPNVSNTFTDNGSGGNQSNELPLWERRLNQKWNYVIGQFYYKNRSLYEPYEKEYARQYPGLPLPDSLRDMMNQYNAGERKKTDLELAYLKREAVREREMIIKRREDLMKHGIHPDVFNYWRNDLVIENICSVIMDKVQNGIDYKVELLDEEAKFLRHNTVNRVQVATAWEQVFHGGKTEEKLGDIYYQEVARLKAIPQERVLLLDLKDRILRYKLEIFRHQLLREIKKPWKEAADSMEESRITWIEDIIKDPEKQAEVYNHAMDYIKRVKNNENARWCRTAAPIHMEWAEYYLSKQKPGTLNFKLFDPEKADRFTLDMIDRFLKQDYDLLESELRQEQEKLEREKWRQENPTEVKREYDRMVVEVQRSYEAFQEEQRKLKEEERLANQRSIKRREEREKKGDDDDIFF